MFGWLALLLLWTPQEPTTSSVAKPVIVRTFEPTNLGARRCLRDLKRDVSARITCRVNSIATPTSCMFEPDTLTNGERYAVECYARTYRFRYEDGRPATGETVSFMVELADD
jgi:hypothetical protein